MQLQPFWNFLISGGFSPIAGYAQWGNIRENYRSCDPVPEHPTYRAATTSIMSTVVLPGEELPREVLPVPSNPSIALKLGPGLRYIPPSTITPVVAGSLCVDNKKNAIWVENNNGRVNH